MPVQLPTDAGQGHYGTQTAFRRLKEHADAVESQLLALQDQVSGLPAALTLDQIQRALSADGSNPLNLTNLQGTPATQNPTVPGPPAPAPGPGPGPTPPPPTPPGPGPCGPRANHVDTVSQAKSDLVAQGEDLSGACGAFKITSIVVSRLQATGEAIGTIIKATPPDSTCQGRSSGAVMYANGAVYDILEDQGGLNGPQWNFAGNRPITDYDGPACP